MKTYFSVLVVLFLTISCSEIKDKNEKELQLLKNIDGSSIILDQEKKQILVVSQSNRIVDVVDLELTLEQITSIKKQKELNDNKVKVNYWSPFIPPKEKYEISLATRYYKDQCLYKITIEPCDNRLQQGQFVLKSLHLYDESGFTLEEVILPVTGWTKLVDADGKPKEYQLVGKIPMTLDNYMEISNWSCTWIR